MSEHKATIEWKRQPHPQDERTYSRNHVATLNGGQTLNVSASTEYKGDGACADPEQLLINAVASCHMLTFLAIAEFQGYRVAEYRDNAVGYLEKNDAGKMAVTRIVLSPAVTFAGDKRPDEAALAKIHAGAHKNCFIANSVTADVTVAGAVIVA